MSQSFPPGRNLLKAVWHFVLSPWQTIFASTQEVVLLGLLEELKQLSVNILSLNPLKSNPSSPQLSGIINSFKL